MRRYSWRASARSIHSRQPGRMLPWSTLPRRVASSVNSQSLRCNLTLPMAPRQIWPCHMASFDRCSGILDPRSLISGSAATGSGSSEDSLQLQLLSCKEIVLRTFVASACCSYARLAMRCSEMSDFPHEHRCQDMLRGGLQKASHPLNPKPQTLNPKPETPKP